MKQKIALMLDPEWDRDGRPEFAGPIRGFNRDIVYDSDWMTWQWEQDDPDFPEVKQLHPLDWVRKTEQAVLRDKRIRRKIMMRRARA